ncbi:hypothetical protein AB4Z48_16740 [Cupriavidus sp. 2TAF22]
MKPLIHDFHSVHSRHGKGYYLRLAACLLLPAAAYLCVQLLGRH